MPAPNFKSLLSKDHRNLIVLSATLVVLIAIPITVYLTLNSREPTSRAEIGGAIRGSEGDLWADIVIGKRDFGQITPGFVNPQRVIRPGGAVVDRDSAGSTKGRLWVWDGMENRLLGVNLDGCPPTTGDCTATKVIGQPSLSDYSACNGDSSFQYYPLLAAPSASSICGVSEEEVSIGESLSVAGLYSKNSNLYVPDLRNHRVLIYYDPWNTDSIADEVLGQDTFTTGGCNKSTAAPVTHNSYLDSIPSNSSLCLYDPQTQAPGAGVALDNSGNLWVADNGNNRVLRFPKQGSVFSKTADTVIGQTSFTVGPLSDGSGLNQLKNPTSLRFDASGNLYVADLNNRRVLKYTPAQQTTGSSGSVFASNSSWPTIYVGEIDTVNQGIWVTTSSAYQLALFGFDGTLKKSINIAQGVSGSVGIAKDNSMVATSLSQGVVYFANRMGPYPQCLGHDCWDAEILRSGSTNQSRLSGANGVAIAANQMFVADNCRVLVWNNPDSLTNGKLADHVLFQTNFTNFNCNLFQVSRLKADSDNQIYIGTDKGTYIYQAPVTSSSTPRKILDGNITTLEGQSITIPRGPQGIAPQKIGTQLFLWLSDVDNNRVLRIRDPLGTPKVDVVVGQANLTGTACNRGGSRGQTSPLNLLCYPGAISVDKNNNIFISDFSLIGTEIQVNYRLLMFAASKFPANNTSTIFDSFADKNISQWAFETAFDNTNRMVVGVSGYSSRFVPYLSDPVNGSSTTPDGYLKDFVSWPYGATFDSVGNLYIADSIHSRVLIYKKPFFSVPKQGDINGDGQVNSADLSILISTWGSATDLRADVNSDGRINSGDLALLISRWGT